MLLVFFQAEDGIRDLVRSRGLGDVYKRQGLGTPATRAAIIETLLKRQYILREKKHLVATDLGLSLIHI